MSTLLIQVLNPFAFLLASLLLLLLGLLSLLSSSTSCPQPEKRTGSQSLGRASMQVRWLDASTRFCNFDDLVRSFHVTFLLNFTRFYCPFSGVAWLQASLWPPGAFIKPSLNQGEQNSQIYSDLWKKNSHILSKQILTIQNIKT